MIRDLAVVVLAGGEGSRIGGGKPVRRLGGTRLIDRAIALARNWSEEVRVAVRSAGRIDGLGAGELVDHPAIEGPLGGLAAGLRFAREAGRTAILTIPCDTPFLPGDLPDRLDRAIGGAIVAIAASAGKLHPTCALWRVGALGSLPAYRSSGRRSLLGFAEAVGHVPVDWPAEPFDPFFNVNSEADLRLAEGMLRP